VTIRLKIRIIVEALISLVLFILAGETFARALGGEWVIVDKSISFLERMVSFLWEERETLLWGTVGTVILYVAVRVVLKLMEDIEDWESQRF
jgi:hypothetical protein